MLRLHRHLVSVLRAASPLTTSSLLRRRLLSTTRTSVARFVPDDYLVAKCGLTPEQAREASKHLTCFSSPSNPDAVRAFLRDLGLTKSAAATVVVRHPQILCSNVCETLAPCVDELRKIDLSLREILRLVKICPELILSPLRVSRLAFYLSFMGSCDSVRVAIENNPDLLEQSLEDVVKPNLEFLCQAFKCDACRMANAINLAPWLLTASEERLKAIAALGEECSVIKSGPRLLCYAVVADQSLLREKIATKVELLKSYGLSSGRVGILVSWKPAFFLKRSEELMRRTLDFLTKEAGLDLEVDTILPVMFQYSTENRLVPRFNVLKILTEKNWLDEDEAEAAAQHFWDIMCTMPMRDFERILVRPYEDPDDDSDAISAAYAPVRARYGVFVWTNNDGFDSDGFDRYDEDSPRYRLFRMGLDLHP